MAQNVEPYEILAGPADVFFAPVGTPFPTLAATYTEGTGFSAPAGASAWKKVGYTEGGVNVNHAQTVVEIRADQVTAPVKAVRSEEGLEININIASITLENYALALNQANSGVVSGAGEKSLRLYRGGSLVQTLALLVRNNNLSPYEDGPLQYEAPAVFNTGAPEVAFVKDDKSVLACSFHAIADPDRTSDEEAFGRLRVSA